MCLHQTTAQPMATGIDPTQSPTDQNENFNPGSPAIKGPTQTTAQVNTPTKVGRALELASGGVYDPTGGVDTGAGPAPGQPTKFSALMKMVAPMMQGAAIGGFLGKSTPGGGFAAANNFFLQRRMMDMQRSQFLINMMKLQSEVQKNQAEAQWAMRRPMVTRTAPAIKGYDDSGKPIFMSQNPQTGEYESVEGVHPGRGNTKEISTDQGIVTYDPENPQAGALPLTLGPRVGSAADAKNDTQAGTAESASEPSERTEPPRVPYSNKPGAPLKPVPQGSPSQSPAAIAATGGGLPLHAPGFGKQKPAKVTNRTASGQETDNLIDENPDSPTYGQVIKKSVASRAPLPDKTAGRETNKENQNADVETYAGEALKRMGNDPDKAIDFINNLKTGDPEADKKLKAMLPNIRKSIRDRVKQGKKRLTLSPEDQKAAGITPSASSVIDEDEENQ